MSWTFSTCWCVITWKNGYCCLVCWSFFSPVLFTASMPTTIPTYKQHYCVVWYITTTYTYATIYHHHVHRPTPHNASCPNASAVFVPMLGRKNTASTSCRGWYHHVCKWSVCAKGQGTRCKGISVSWSGMQQQHATPTTTTTNQLRISTGAIGVNDPAIIATCVRAASERKLITSRLCPGSNTHHTCTCMHPRMHAHTHAYTHTEWNSQHGHHLQLALHGSTVLVPTNVITNLLLLTSNLHLWCHYPLQLALVAFSSYQTVHLLSAHTWINIINI